MTHKDLINESKVAVNMTQRLEQNMDHFNELQYLAHCEKLSNNQANLAIINKCNYGLGFARI